MALKHLMSALMHFYIGLYIHRHWNPACLIWTMSRSGADGREFAIL
jgi:hypothetical protein